MSQNPAPSRTAHAFYHAWRKEVERRSDEVLEKWSQARNFTNMVISDDGSILQGVAKSLSLEAYGTNYYSLDALLFDPKDHVNTVFPIGEWSFFYHIRVAFEHENFFNSGLFQEVSHLLITNCDLRVIVTYPDRDSRDELRKLHDLISHHPQQAQFSDQENFLMIFGYRDGPRWEGRVYKASGWTELH